MLEIIKLTAVMLPAQVKYFQFKRITILINYRSANLSYNEKEDMGRRIYIKRKLSHQIDNEGNHLKLGINIS